MKIGLAVYLAHIGNSIFGMYQQPYSAEWDSLLNSILDEGRIKEVRSYTITFDYQGNDIEVWCANKWYSFGHVHCVNGQIVGRGREFRPGIKTMVRLWEIYSALYEKQLDSDYLSLFKRAD